MRKIRKSKAKINTTIETVKEEPIFSMKNFKNYPRIIGMFILLLFVPPIGWLFAYKYSPFDKKTSIIISAFCTCFFVYAVFISPEHEWIDTAKLTREDFCERYNKQADKLVPNLDIKLDEKKFVVGRTSFAYTITDTIRLQGKIDDDTLFVKEVSVIATPKNTDESFQMLNSCGLVVATLSPELDQDKRSDVFRELKVLEKAADENFEASTVKGRITYSLKNDSGKFTFTAQINDDF